MILVNNNSNKWVNIKLLNFLELVFLMKNQNRLKINAIMILFISIINNK